jgi:hypothetical protein
VSDTTANIQANLVALLADAKVDNIDSTQDGTAITLTAAQAILAANMAKLQGTDTVTVSDTTANIQANLVALLADAKVDNIDSTQDGTAITLTAAQAIVAANMAKLQGTDTVTVSDTTANIQANLVALLADAKVDNIDSTQDGTAITLTAAQAIVAANTAKLAVGDTVHLIDTNISGANAVTAGADAKIDVINATDNLISLTHAQYTSLNAAGLTKVDATDTVAITATQQADSVSTANINGVMKMIYTLGTQTTTFEFDDVGDSGDLTNGVDTFQAANVASVDALTFAANDVLDLTAFALSSGQRAATAVFDGDTRTVDDQTFALVRGNWDADGADNTANTADDGVFTYSTTGNALLVLWDSNTVGGTVVQSGVVLTGVTSLLAGTTILGS